MKLVTAAIFIPHIFCTHWIEEKVKRHVGGGRGGPLVGGAIGFHCNNVDTSAGAAGYKGMEAGGGREGERELASAGYVVVTAQGEEHLIILSNAYYGSVQQPISTLLPVGMSSAGR